jgi:hypothetical protein
MQHWPYASHLMLEFGETKKCRHNLHNTQTVFSTFPRCTVEACHGSLQLPLPLKWHSKQMEIQ